MDNFNIHDWRFNKITLEEGSFNEAKTPYTIVVMINGERLAVDNEDIPRLKSGKEVVGYSLKYAGEEAWVYPQFVDKIEDNVEEGIFDRFKKKSSSEERPIGTGTTMDGDFGFASDESYELLKKLAKEMGGKLTGMGENERYISFGLETIENDRYTEREYYYDKETKKVIKKKSSNNERPIGTGTTMDGDFGFASDESIKLIKNLTKKMDGELSGMGENERYISFSLATTEDDTYTERDYFYDKVTNKIIEKGISKQLPENAEVDEATKDSVRRDTEEERAGAQQAGRRMRTQVVSDKKAAYKRGERKHKRDMYEEALENAVRKLEESRKKEQDS